MNRQIEQALVRLLPTLNDELPPRLVQLAGSLLAQSRSKASNLKAEEEIARSYACANLACERLKHALNLPKIEAHPPCPPKIYQKLYAHLELALQPKKRGRPPKDRSAAGETQNDGHGRGLLQQNREQPSQITAKSNAEESIGVPARQGYTPRKRTHLEANKPTDVPGWIMSVTRQLCKELDAMAAPPHILAGVTSILTLPVPYLANNPSLPAARKRDSEAALIVAVYYFVTSRLSDLDADANQYLRQRQLAIDALKKLKANGELLQDIHEIKAGEVDLWVKEITERGWLRLDWFTNIPAGVGLETTEDQEMGAEQSPAPTLNDKSRPRTKTLRRGLGTMLQPSLDLCSEEMRLDYADWKRWVLTEMERIEQRQSSGHATA